MLICDLEMPVAMYLCYYISLLEDWVCPNALLGLYLYSPVNGGGPGKVYDVSVYRFNRLNIFTRRGNNVMSQYGHECIFIYINKYRCMFVCPLKTTNCMYFVRFLTINLGQWYQKFKSIWNFVLRLNSKLPCDIPNCPVTSQIALWHPKLSSD